MSFFSLFFSDTSTQLFGSCVHLCVFYISGEKLATKLILKLIQMHVLNSSIFNKVILWVEIFSGTRHKMCNVSLDGDFPPNLTICFSVFQLSVLVFRYVTFLVLSIPISLIKLLSTAGSCFQQYYYYLEKKHFTLSGHQTNPSLSSKHSGGLAAKELLPSGLSEDQKQSYSCTSSFNMDRDTAPKEMLIMLWSWYINMHV